MSDLSISLIQTAPHWEESAANLALFEQKIKALDQEQVVVLPEMFNTGFSMNAAALAEPMNGPTVNWMKKTARQQNIILTGSVIIKEKQCYYNRLLWVLPNGSLAHYDKRHLFSYAGEDKVFTPGNARLISSTMGWKIGLFICYDLRFPVWLRQLNAAAARYDLLIVGANWPASRITQWDTLLKARAIENQCFVAGVNRVGTDGNKLVYNGHSAIYDPLGNQLRIAENTAEVITCTLSKAQITDVRHQFPFLEDADDFVCKSQGNP